MKRPTYAELEILVECLLDKVKKLTEENDQDYLHRREDRDGFSIMNSFLVNKHPELTTEYTEYVRKELHNNVFGDEERTAKACKSALLYHSETIDDENLDEVMQEIANKLKNQK